MRRFLAVAVLLAIICSCSPGRFASNRQFPAYSISYFPEGCLEEVFYRSSSGGPSQRRMLVYLPAGYYEEDSRYPVLYMLHGARGNEMSWIAEGRILQNADSLTRSGAMQKTIIVFPNMNRYKDEKDFGKSRQKNAVESAFGLDGGVEAMFMKDVVTTVDSLFRTIPGKDARAIAGLSIGAYQAMHISASFPDGFGYVGIFSPVVHAYTTKGPYRGFYKGFKKKLEAQFTDPPEKYSIMSGRNDVFFPRIQRLIMHIENKGYPFEFTASSGGHQWSNWEDYSIRFMEELWKVTDDMP